MLLEVLAIEINLFTNLKTSKFLYLKGNSILSKYILLPTKHKFYFLQSPDIFRVNPHPHVYSVLVLLNHA